MEVNPTSHTPAHNVTAAAAPFRAWPTITKPAWRRAAPLYRLISNLQPQTEPGRNCAEQPAAPTAGQQLPKPATGMSHCVESL